MVNIADGVTIAVMVLGFIGQTFFLRGSFEEKLRADRRDIEGLKKTVQYADTCQERYNGVKDRVARLETISNGKSK